MSKTIFISHSSKDKPTVRRLVNDLQRRGISVWFDEYEIKVGERFVDKIQKGISESKYIGIWITRNAISSGWVEKEWQSRLSEEISKRNTVILPLLAEDCYDLIPTFLADKQYADFRYKYEDGLYDLLKVLEREKQISEMMAKRKENIEKRKLAKQAEDELINQKLQEKILKKAETIKKQQSKKEKLIDSVVVPTEKVAPTIEYKERIVYLPAPEKKIVPKWV